MLAHFSPEVQLLLLLASIFKKKNVINNIQVIVCPAFCVKFSFSWRPSYPSLWLLGGWRILIPHSFESISCSLISTCSEQLMSPEQVNFVLSADLLGLNLVSYIDTWLHRCLPAFALKTTSAHPISCLPPSQSVTMTGAVPANASVSFVFFWLL